MLFYFCTNNQQIFFAVARGDIWFLTLRLEILFLLFIEVHEIYLQSNFVTGYIRSLFFHSCIIISRLSLRSFENFDDYVLHISDNRSCLFEVYCCIADLEVLWAFNLGGVEAFTHRLSNLLCLLVFSSVLNDIFNKCHFFSMLI